MVAEKTWTRIALHPKLQVLSVPVVLPLFFYAILSVALTWPTIAHFTTQIVSQGIDARHNLWVMWHYQQALLGHQPFFYGSLLYYPNGISMLVHGNGPIFGLLGLPFVPLGAEASFNGAVLVGFLLTGYCTFLLARTLQMEYVAALFAGTVVLCSEMHLAGLLGHVEKVFLALLPLVLLTWHNALDTKRSRWWAPLTALVFLLLLLTSGWQFVIAVLGVTLLGCIKFVLAKKSDRIALLKRMAVAAAVSTVLVAPLLVAINLEAQNPALNVNLGNQSLALAPDLIEFFLPSRFSLLLGDTTRKLLETNQIAWSIESTVSLSFTALVLSVLALAGQKRTTLPWLILLGACMLLALGPTLKLWGRPILVEPGLSITLPYAWLNALPGFRFMRTPGVFMMLGFVSLGILAGFGLSHLTKLRPRYGRLIAVLGIVLILIETWPQPWPEETLPPVPEFYQQISQDPTEYGVFDLPTAVPPSHDFISHSSIYQIYQITHGKGIASGYLSRGYFVHPVFPCWIPTTNRDQNDLLLNDRQVGCSETAKLDLAREGYRYVVYHKPLSLASIPVQRTKRINKQTREAYAEAKDFIQKAFGNEAPIKDDPLTKVYAVPPVPDTSQLPTSIQFGENWYWRESGFRWAHSTATLRITSPRAQPAVLEIRPRFMFDPKSPKGLGAEGSLIVETEDEDSRVFAMRDSEMTAIPIELKPGFQQVKLTLQNGNFRIADYGLADPRVLSFSIRSIRLKTQE